MPIAELAIDDCANLLPYCKEPKPFLDLLADADTLHPLNAAVLRADATDWFLQCGQYREALSTSAPLNYVHTWMLAGAFDNRDNSGFERVYEPEKEIDFERAVEGRSRKVHWFALDAAPCDGRVQFAEMFEPHSHSHRAYAATLVKAEKRCQAVLRAGCAGALKVFVNGTLAGVVPTYNDFGRDKIAQPIALREGWNLILVKAAVVEETQWAFSLRLCDLQGGALKGVTFHNSPNALAEYKKETSPAPRYPLPQIFKSEEEALRARPQLGLLTLLQQRVAANPNDAYALTLLAVTMDTRKLGEKNSSSTDLTERPLRICAAQCILNRSNPFIPLELASVTEDPNEARTAVEGVLKAHPDFPYAYEMLAYLAHEGHCPHRRRRLCLHRVQPLPKHSARHRRAGAGG